MSNKIIALFISILLLFNAAGYLLIFKIQQAIIQCRVSYEIENYSNNDNLELIIVNIIDLRDGNSKFNWIKEGKEFRYNGKMYDVVQSKEANGKLFLYCRNDFEEEELLNNISLLISKNISKKHFLTFHISTFLKNESIRISPLHLKEAVINLNYLDYKGIHLRCPNPLHVLHIKYTNNVLQIRT